MSLTYLKMRWLINCFKNQLLLSVIKAFAKSINYFVLFLYLNTVSCTHRNNQTYLPTYSKENDVRKVLFLGVPTKGYGEVLKPLVQYINKNNENFDLHLVVSSSLTDFEGKLANNYFDFALVNPTEAIRFSDKGYKIFAKLSNDKNYKGVIVVKKKSEIRSKTDLKNHQICFTDTNALAGTMMTLYYLSKQGINIRKDISTEFVGSEESVLMNLQIGNCQAASIWYSSWQRFQHLKPEISSEMEVLWETPSLVNIAFLARKDIDPANLSIMKSLLFSIQQSKEGKEVLRKTFNDSFIPASKNNYLPVQMFLKKYHQTIE